MCLWKGLLIDIDGKHVPAVDRCQVAFGRTRLSASLPREGVGKGCRPDRVERVPMGV